MHAGPNQDGFLQLAIRHNVFSDMWQLIKNKNKCTGLKWSLWDMTVILALVNTPLELWSLHFLLVEYYA